MITRYKASNRWVLLALYLLIDVENMTEDQILIIQKHYENLNSINQKAIKQIKEETDDMKDSIEKNVNAKV